MPYELSWVFLEALLAAIMLLSPRLRTLTADVPITHYHRWSFAPDRIFAVANNIFDAAAEDPEHCPLLPPIKALKLRPGAPLGGAWCSLDAFFTLKGDPSIKRIDLTRTDMMWDFRPLNVPHYLPNLQDIRLDRGVHTAARMARLAICRDGGCLRVDMTAAWKHRETLASFLKNRAERLKRLHYFISAEALQPVPTCYGSPALHLIGLSELQCLAHLETDTSAIYGPIAQVLRISLSVKLPPNLRFLRLVEDWSLQRRLEGPELPEYRKTMYGHLGGLVKGYNALLRIQTIISEPHLGVYWSGLSGPAEWRRGANASDPFTCLREAVEADESMSVQVREVSSDVSDDGEMNETGNGNDDDDDWRWAGAEGEEQEEGYPRRRRRRRGGRSSRE